MLDNVKTVKLEAGAHSAGEGKACVMEVVAMLYGEEFSDRPSCACPVLSAFARRFNDWLRDDERHVLWPFTLRLGNTRADRATTVARGFRMADFAVRTAAPLRLEAAGRHAQAEQLRSLSPIVDRASALAGRTAAYAAAADAYAAYAAADAAAAAADAYAAYADAYAAYADAYAAYADAYAAYAAAYAAAAYAAAAAADAYAADAAAYAAAYAADAAADAAALSPLLRKALVEASVALLDELCPPAPTAELAAALAWAAVEAALSPAPSTLQSAQREQPVTTAP